MSDIKIIEQSITIDEVRVFGEQWYPEMIKGVCDVVKNVIALGGEMHADAEAALLDNGSQQNDLWGFNIYFNVPQKESIEFSSLINIRPAMGNRSIMITDKKIKSAVEKVIFKRITWE